MPIAKEVLFKVLRNTDNHLFVIYTDGTVDGFGDDLAIFNRYAVLKREAYLSGANSTSRPLAIRTSTSDALGAAYSVPA